MNARRIVLGIFGIVGASACAPTTVPQPEITGGISAGFGRGNAGISSGSGTRGGTLTPRILYSSVYAHVDSAGRRSEWLRAILLWRGAPGWLQAKVDPERSRAASEEYRRVRTQALVADRTMLGGSGVGTVYWAEMDSDGRVLYVHGKEFEVPVRDSTLVVLIDDVDGSRGSPRVVGTVFVNGTVPSDAQSKSWTSGDTSYTVRPKRSYKSVVREALEQSEVAREFIRPD